VITGEARVNGSFIGARVTTGVAGVPVPGRVVQPEESTHRRVTTTAKSIMAGFITKGLILISISYERLIHRI
jgi:hypothetical protein